MAEMAAMKSIMNENFKIRMAGSHITRGVFGERNYSLLDQSNRNNYCLFEE